MPAPVLMRATFFFKDTRGLGWSETLYTLKPTLLEAKIAAIDLAPKRIACLGNTAGLFFIRVSDDLVKRDSAVTFITPGNQLGPLGGAEGADIAHTCLLVRMQAAPTVRRSLYMRGIPDNVDVLSGQFASATPFTPAFNAWALELISNGWAIRSKDPNAPTTAITAVTQTGNTVTVETGLAHGLAANDPITIISVKGATQLNGSWVVATVPNVTEFTIKCAFVLKSWDSGGFVAKKLYNLTGLTAVQANRLSHRISGRPFDLARGRRRVTKRT